MFPLLPMPTCWASASRYIDCLLHAFRYAYLSLRRIEECAREHRAKDKETAEHKYYGQCREYFIFLHSVAGGAQCRLIARHLAHAVAEKRPLFAHTAVGQMAKSYGAAPTVFYFEPAAELHAVYRCRVCDSCTRHRLLETHIPDKERKESHNDGDDGPLRGIHNWQYIKTPCRHAEVQPCLLRSRVMPRPR